MHVTATVTSLTAKLKVFDAEDEVLPEIVPPLPGIVDRRLNRGRSRRGGRGHIWRLRISYVIHVYFLPYGMFYKLVFLTEAFATITCQL